MPEITNYDNIVISSGEAGKYLAWSGAEPYKRDLKNLEFRLLDTGHFALQEDGDQIAELMRNFLRQNVKRQTTKRS